MWLTFFVAILPICLSFGPEWGRHHKLCFQTHSSSTVPGPKQHTRETTEDEDSICFHGGSNFRGDSNSTENEAIFYFISNCSVKLIYFPDKENHNLSSLYYVKEWSNLGKKYPSWWLLITILLCFLLFNRWEMLSNFSVKKGTCSMVQQHELAFLILHGVESSQNAYVRNDFFFSFSRFKKI